MPPRVLLDTNVWRRLSDAEAIEPVRMRAKASKVRILVAPAVVYEMLRTPGPELRARLVKAVTLGSGKRLMPESFEECRGPAVKTLVDGRFDRLADPVD